MRGNEVWSKLTKFLLMIAMGVLTLFMPMKSAQAAQAATPASGPPLWQVRDADTVIYLLGTVHSVPPGTDWRSPAVNRAVREADRLYLETLPETAMDRKALSRLLRRSRTGHSLVERLKPENREILRELAAASGMTLERLDRYPPWLAMFMLLGNREGMTGGGVAAAPESVLAKEFKARGASIAALEDGMTVIERLNGIAEADQLAALDEYLDSRRSTGSDGSGHGADIERLVAAWLAGDVDSLARQISAERMGETYFDILFTRRNRDWTEKIGAMLAQPGTSLVAVGVGHLVGEDSLPDLLAQRGLKVERMDRVGDEHVIERGIAHGK